MPQKAYRHLAKVLFTAVVGVLSASQAAAETYSVTKQGRLDGAASSIAVAINESGQVVGGADIAGGGSRAFITGPNGVGMTDLGTF